MATATHTMQLEIVTPMGQKLKDTVTELTAPGVMGELGILPGHIAIMTVLDIGKMSFTPAAGGAPKVLAVNGGFLEVAADKLIVLTETAEFATEIDVARAQTAKERAEKALATLESGSASFEQTERARKRAEVRLVVAGAGH